MNNLSQGNLFKHIASFSLPYLFSYFLQTLYGMADLFIVGQYNGAAVITAVSVGSQIMHMLTVMIVGLAMGSTVMIGRYVGARQEDQTMKAIGNTMTLFAGVACLLTVILIGCVRPITFVMSTPAEAVSQTVTYLMICFIGVPFIVFYNVIASVFRGMGDSRTPMKFVAISCGINILLDYILIGGLGLQSAGAALGTVIAQTCSVLFALYSIRKKKFPLHRKDLRPNRQIMTGILKIGVPIMAQDGFIQISFLVITIIANRRGVDVAAAVGIVEKIITFLFLVPSTMLSTISTIASQSIGAGQMQRAKQTLWICSGIAAGIGLFFVIGFQFGAASVLSLFTSDQAVIRLGTQYIRSYVFDCVIASFHFGFCGYFAASGLSVISFIQNCASIILVRIPGAYLASVYFPDTLYPMGWAAPLGGVLQIAICIAAYRYITQSKKV